MNNSDLLAMTNPDSRAAYALWCEENNYAVCANDVAGDPFYDANAGIWAAWQHQQRVIDELRAAFEDYADALGMDLRPHRI